MLQNTLVLPIIENGLEKQKDLEKTNAVTIKQDFEKKFQERKK